MEIVVRLTSRKVLFVFFRLRCLFSVFCCFIGIATLLLIAGCINENSHNLAGIRDVKALLPLFPDSALVVLEGISIGELTDEEQVVTTLLRYDIYQLKEYEYNNDSLLSIIISGRNHLKDDHDIALALFYRGVYAVRQGNDKKALDLFHKAESYAAGIKDMRLLGRIYHAYADFFRSVMLFSNSLRYGEKAMACFIDAGDSISANRTLRTIILSDLVVGNEDKAYSGLYETTSFAKRKNDTKYIVCLLRELILYEIFMNDIPRAKVLFGNLNDFIGEEEYTATAYIALGAFCLNENDCEKAAYYMNIADKLPKTNYEKFKFNIQMMRLHRITGDYSAAFSYFDRYKVLYDSIFGMTRHTLLGIIEDKALELEVQLSELKVKDQREEMAYVTLIICFAFVAVLFYYQTMLRKRKTELRKRMAVIDDLKVSKETLMEKLNVWKDNELELKRGIEKMFAGAKGLADLYYQNPQNYGIFPKKVRGVLVQDPLHKDFHANFITIVNNYYNNILENLAVAHPELTENDLLLCGLLISGFTPQQISIILNSGSIDGVYSRKYRLKHKLTGSKAASLEDYLLSFRSE